MFKFRLHLAMLWALVLPQLVAAVTFSVNGDEPQLLKNATIDELQAAIQLVEDALEESAKRNVARLEHIRHNKYSLAPNTRFGRRAADATGEDGVPHLLQITPELAAAAALVAEAEIAQGNITGTKVTENTLRKRDGFWMENIERRGSSPWGDDPNYKIFRNVKDYGAKGDGSTDDTKKIQDAIKDGKRCGAGCNGSSTKNAIIYFPPGTYVVSQSIDVYFGTQLIGDANSPPLIKASSRFLGLGVFSTDKYTGDGLGADGKDNEWYINTANFYRQMRNFRIDTTATRAASHVCGLHYQVAQATSLQNIEFISGDSARGIFAENGSGGSMSDLTFTGGEYGIYGGSQQFTTNRLSFSGCKTAVRLIWDWGWLWKNSKVEDCDTGFEFLPEKKSNESASKENGDIGSAAFMEFTFRNVKKAIVVQVPSDKPGTGTTGLVLNKVTFSNVDKPISDTDDDILLTNVEEIDSWIFGPVYQGTERSWALANTFYGVGRSKTLLDGDSYLERPKPQYEDVSASDFIHLKDYAKGDGSTDDTQGVQKFFDQGGFGKPLFADAGIYLLTDTVTIRPFTKLVGEAWTQFAATGPGFGDMNKPKVMIQVGYNSGEVGDVEMQDLLFTTKGPTPGAILVQWNLSEKNKGGAALWDCHFRLGGATGTELTPKECPALTTGEVKDECISASLMMHITANATGYFDNMWLWVADHMIDDPDLSDNKNDMTQVSIYAARGLLLESKRGVWLYGTASEHCVLYQYNFNEAEAVFAGLLQTESAYFQPSPPAPVPFTSTIDDFAGDPVYKDCDKAGGRQPGCDSSWGLILSNNRHVHIAAAGIYSWFHTYTQDCIDEHSCQNSLILLNDNFEEVRIEQLITIGAENSFTTASGSVLSTDNLAIDTHPSWSQISFVNASTTASDGDDGDGNPDWKPCGKNPYSTLEDLEAAIGTIPGYCIIPWAIEILFKRLKHALELYNSLLANGYDNSFTHYKDYINTMIDARMRQFVWSEDGEGNKYFTCTEQQETGPPTAPRPCPIPRRDIATFPTLTIDYHLADHDGFFGAIEKKWGINESWISFDRSYHVPSDCNHNPAECVNHTYTHEPQKSDNVTVPDPKDLIADSVGGYRTLYGSVAGIAMETIFGQWDGAPEDALNVLSVPVFMTEIAVDNMKEVKKIGDEWEDEQAKQLALDIVGIVLFVLPFLGPATQIFGRVGALVGRMITFLDVLGQSSVTMYDLIERPLSAPLDIMGALLGFKAKPVRNGEGMAQVGKIRKSFTKADVDALGDVFRKRQDVVDKLLARVVATACGGRK